MIELSFEKITRNLAIFTYKVKLIVGRLVHSHEPIPARFIAPYPTMMETALITIYFDELSDKPSYYIHKCAYLPSDHYLPLFTGLGDYALQKATTWAKAVIAVLEAQHLQSEKVDKFKQELVLKTTIPT